VIGIEEEARKQLGFTIKQRVTTIIATHPETTP